MTTLRTAAQQALEALEFANVNHWWGSSTIEKAITDLRAALSQQAEPVQEPDYWQEEARRYAGNADYWRKRYEALAEPVKEPASLKRGTTGRCTRKVCECEKEGLGLECIYLEPVVDGYPLWSGIPKAEPVQEPVASIFITPNGAREFDDWRHDLPVGSNLLYTAPPQRKPLTDEEILEAVGWERAEMYMKLTPNFPVEEARKETIKNARAVERKVRGEEK